MSETALSRWTNGSARRKWRFADATGALRDLALGVSIRTKILGIIVSLIVILGVGVTTQVRSAMDAVLVSELDKRGASVAGDLAGRVLGPASVGDMASAQALLVDSLEHNQDLIFAYLAKPGGEVQVSASVQDGLLEELELTDLGDVEEGLIHRHGVLENSVIHHFEARIPGGDFGTIHVGFGEDRIAEVITDTTTRMLLLTLVAAMAGVAAAGLLTWILTRPIVDLVETTRRVGEGDLTVRSQYRASDEIGSLSSSFNAMVEELQRSREAIDRSQRARTSLIEKLIGAQEEERRRLARALHDSVGQSLGSLSVGIALMDKLEGVEADVKAAELQELASEALMQVREISRELRPSVLDDLGLEATLERCAEDITARYPATEVDVHIDVEGRLPSATETTLYRIVQEALANSVRHARPGSIDVLVVQRNGQVRAIVEDNGRGFNVEEARARHDSVGIHTMRERAELLGGTLDIESGPGGTMVVAELPV